VWVLGLAALLNDASSEMITPLLPVFLSLSLGAGPAIIGLIEGLAEATSSFFKVLSGRWVDRGASAGSLVIAGYTVSVTARPWMGLAGSLLGWPVIMFLRFLDRVGKGLRTSPRDSLIADIVEPGARGRAFGLHRALDHTGAVIGPLVAAALLAAGWSLRSVFLFAAVPGLLVLVNLFVGLSPRLNDRHEAAKPVPVKPLPAKMSSEGLGFRASWRVMPKEVRGLILGGGVLAMVAVPEMLLVLWATSAGSFAGAWLGVVVATLGKETSVVAWGLVPLWAAWTQPAFPLKKWSLAGVPLGLVGAWAAWRIGVFARSGATALTRILRAARSLARERTRLSTAALVAV
jgi:MFS family permease